MSLQLASTLSLAPSSPVPIVKTVATTGEGIGELADAVEGHRRRLEESKGLEEHHLAQARRQVLAAARHLLAERLNEGGGEKRLEELVRAVAARQDGPSERGGAAGRADRRLTVGGRRGASLFLTPPIAVDMISVPGAEDASG